MHSKAVAWDEEKDEERGVWETRPQEWPVEESWGFHRPEEVVDWAEKPKNQWEEVMPGEGGADMVDIEAWQREVFEALTEAQSMEEAREAFKKVKAAKEKAIINRWCDGVEERERQERTGEALVELEQMLAPIMEGHRSRFMEEREREQEMGAAQLEYLLEVGHCKHGKYESFFKNLTCFFRELGMTIRV